MSILVETRMESGESICVVTIDRPEVRNAVDRSTAHELAAAFRAFDADPALNVAIQAQGSQWLCGHRMGNHG